MCETFLGEMIHRVYEPLKEGKLSFNKIFTHNRRIRRSHNNPGPWYQLNLECSSVLSVDGKIILHTHTDTHTTHLELKSDRFTSVNVYDTTQKLLSILLC